MLAYLCFDAWRCVFCVEAKDEDKKEATASASASTSMLNLAGMVPLAKDKRHHSGVGVFCVTCMFRQSKLWDRWRSRHGIRTPARWYYRNWWAIINLAKCTKLHKFQHFPERYSWSPWSPWAYTSPSLYLQLIPTLESLEPSHLIVWRNAFHLVFICFQNFDGIQSAYYSNFYSPITGLQYPSSEVG